MLTLLFALAATPLPYDVDTGTDYECQACLPLDVELPYVNGGFDKAGQDGVNVWQSSRASGTGT